MDQVSCYICWEDPEYLCSKGRWIFYIPEYQLLNLSPHKHTYEEIRKKHRKITHAYLSRDSIEECIKDNEDLDEQIKLWVDLERWMKNQNSHPEWEEKQVNLCNVFVVLLYGFLIGFLLNIR